MFSWLSPFCNPTSGLDREVTAIIDEDTNICDIPDQVILRIAGYLDPLVLLRWSLANKRFNKIFSDIDLWKAFLKRKFANNQSTSLTCDDLQIITGNDTVKNVSLKTLQKRLVLDLRDYEEPQIYSPATSKALIIGLDNAGKTSCIYKLFKNDAKIPSKQVSTVEQITHDRKILTIYDLPGTLKMRVLWKHYISGVTHLIWAIDSTDHEKLEASRNLLHDFLARPEWKHFKKSNRRMKFRILVLGLKQDLPSSCTTQQLYECLDLHQITQIGDIPVKWCIQLGDIKSDTGCKNILNGFSWLLADITESRLSSSLQKCWQQKTFNPLIS